MDLFYEKPKEQPYIMFVKIVEEKRGKKRNAVINHSMRWEGDFSYEKVKIVLRKFMNKIGDTTFVTLNKLESMYNPYDPHRVIFGMPQYDNVFYFYILKEEIPKIETDEPMHIVCEAEEFPKNTEKFLDILRKFI